MFQCTSRILYPEDNRFAMLVCQATARKNMDICYNYQHLATPPASRRLASRPGSWLLNPRPAQPAFNLQQLFVAESQSSLAVASLRIVPEFPRVARL